MCLLCTRKLVYGASARSFQWLSSLQSQPSIKRHSSTPCPIAYSYQTSYTTREKNFTQSRNSETSIAYLHSPYSPPTPPPPQHTNLNTPNSSKLGQRSYRETCSHHPYINRSKGIDPGNSIQSAAHGHPNGRIAGFVGDICDEGAVGVVAFCCEDWEGEEELGEEEDLGVWHCGIWG